MNPKVSICIPAYKQAGLLRKALDSIGIQTFKDYELIITDDSPGDDVENLLKEYKFNEKLRYYRNSARLGTPANWNYAVSLARGEYIKMLHGDDFFTSNQSLAKFAEILDNNPRADFGFSSSEVWNISTNEKHIYRCPEKRFHRIMNDPALLFFGNYIGAPSSTIYRNKINLAYDTNLKWLVDTDFYIKVLYRNNFIVQCSEVLICTIDGAEEQVTRTVANDKQIQIKEHIILFNKLWQSNKIRSKNKYSLFFKLLFNKYKVKNLTELNSIIPIQPEQKTFFKKIITSVNYGMPGTRLLLKLYNNRLNKNILKMDLY